jgi:hypothetical protein
LGIADRSFFFHCFVNKYHFQVSLSEAKILSRWSFRPADRYFETKNFYAFFKTICPVSWFVQAINNAHNSRFQNHFGNDDFFVFINPKEMFSKAFFQMILDIFSTDK